MSGSPVHPELKALDGFDPTDIGIDVINSGGVTTSLVLPGSGNIMGGEAFAFKLRKFPKSNRAEEMLLNANLKNESDIVYPNRWMKMACGENAIWNGRSKGLLPESRLGEAFLFRERIEHARIAMEAQDEWCYTASKDNGRNVASSFPNPIEHESLIALLKGEILLNIHCYETYDLEMVVRLSHEFNFKIAAFHHALEAYEVADLLASEGIGAAIFADHWGYKKEAYDASVNGAKILTKAGVLTAFKSDHPVLNAQNLVYEAAKAAGYGLPQDLAIKALTSVPATLMGQEHRIGYIRPYYDADIVLWDKNPLSIGAHPLKVWVDGFSTFEHSDFSHVGLTFHTPANITAPVQGPTILAPSTLSKSLGLDVKVVVEDDVVVCMGVCENRGELVDLKKGWVVPGLIAANVHLGLEEIAQEDDTSAGYLDNQGDNAIHSAFGLQIGQKYSKMLRAAFRAGITTSISFLRFSGAVGAAGVAFRVGVTDFNDDPVISIEVGQNYHIGNGAKSSGYSSSVAGQIEIIRSSSLYLPKIIDVDSNSYIRNYLNIDHRPDPIVILGGAEAHSLAESLAKRNASVILSNARCTPHSWFTRDCLVTGSKPSGYQKLRDAGVNVGVSIREDNFARGLIWEAGWQVADLEEYNKMSEFDRAKEAVGLLTWNIAKAYNLEEKVGRLSVGQRANFVVYDNTPGTLEAKVRLVVDGKYITADTEQF